jgi:hypothetical protein
MTHNEVLVCLYLRAHTHTYTQAHTQLRITKTMIEYRIVQLTGKCIGPICGGPTEENPPNADNPIGP